jgi:hypothetical protein
VSACEVRSSASSYFFKYNTNTDNQHSSVGTHIYTHYISMSTSERLSRFDFKIHEVDHQERLAIDGDVTSY